MRRRGISPVIAVLLLIVIAVAAAILTYVWISGYMGTLQGQAGTEQVEERIKIEGIEVTNGQLTAVYVRNLGSISVTIDAIYVMDTNGNIEAATTGVGKDISVDSASRITTVPSTTFQAGETYIIKVVTERGTEATYRFTYRG